ncbi:hypothetical protein TTHERM_00624650 (macronuclear) [Tetrahymena thermophila SB210]|uniref:Uncharacterized protein n=1 Tax=Tetrahymena thermophila (strain SB210) TaxID=312017 RepID=Q240R8_TETTS|nr:hypothetical protein TTHERM_00624650 [Tetrahymena thermophila SB210]EAS02346.1 hypothetical protein TTHERM_00624650 [Tetrahymena thermophila SB210]|eukprot:XP_001022591.1 hypothetical protein TTHERM_00624650 [Tetrahymena thermophila SB210]
MFNDQKDEVSFNLNSPGQDRQIQELTLDDLNDEDLKIKDQYLNNNNKIEIKNNLNIDSFDIKLNNLKNSNIPPRIQDKYTQDFSYPNNSDFQRYNPSENQPRTINFDTATFENSLDGEESESGLGFADSNKSRPPLGKQNQMKFQKQNEQQHNQFSHSQDSDFDLSDTKLRRLGIINSLKKDAQEYSNLLHNYSKQFKDTNSDSTRLSDQQTTHNAASYNLNNNSFSNNNLFSRENSRNAFDKYGYMLQREGYQQQSASFLTSNPPANPHNLNNKDIQDRMSSINNKIREAYQEFSNTKDPTGFAPTSSQNSASDPYRISINSFKNSLFSAQKENNSYNVNQHHPQSSVGALVKEDKINNLSSYNQFHNSSNYNIDNQNRMDSDAILRSALQAHHLATSGFKMSNQQQQAKPPKNNPVSNLNRVFGETSTMFNEFKKRSASINVTGEEDSRSTNKQTTLTNTVQPSTTISNEPNSYQKYMNIKKKYYDTFLPEKDKIMNNPLKLLKYKIHQRDTQTLDNCKNTLKFIDQEISQNIDPALSNSIYQKSSQQSFSATNEFKI